MPLNGHCPAAGKRPLTSASLLVSGHIGRIVFTTR
jgi:hypothetical protein